MQKLSEMIQSGQLSGRKVEDLTLAHMEFEDEDLTTLVQLIDRLIKLYLSSTNFGYRPGGFFKPHLRICWPLGN